MITPLVAPDMTLSNIHSLCIFCASSNNVDPKYKELAADMGAFVARSGITLVYGGAQGGLMGAAADAALSESGNVIGVMPEILSGQERAHKNLSVLHITKDMHERQKKMADLSDAFLILPGGTGTLAEFFEILTWKQIGVHDKPIILCNAFGFWDSLLETLQHCLKEGFLHHDPQNIVTICCDAMSVKSLLASNSP